jgi:hypothetical protein
MFLNSELEKTFLLEQPSALTPATEIISTAVADRKHRGPTSLSINRILFL